MQGRPGTSLDLGPMRYDYQDICPEGSIDHDGEICVILEELAPDEADLPRYRVRFADGTEAEALEPELTQTGVADAAGAPYSRPGDAHHG